MKLLRSLVSFISLSLVILLLAGCTSAPDTPPPPPPAEKTAEPVSTQPAASVYNQAPMLAEQVTAGKLPPVEERLPKNPVLLQPVERVGQYGGEWHLGILGDRDHASLIRTIGYENLVRWDEPWNNIIPNIAQSVETSPDATTYTFHLREGLRWSDGEPFTAGDIMFWYEAVFSNKQFPKAVQPWLTSQDGQPVKVEKLDDYTVVFRFAGPNGLFLQNLAQAMGCEPTIYPRHYLAQFHPDYNPEVDKLVKEAGLKDWTELFQQKFGDVSGAGVDSPTNWANPELPTLNAWVLTGGYSADTPKVVAERNPYYWKVDVAGNQLPYLDRVIFTKAKDRDEMISWAFNGQIDMQIRHLNQPQMKAQFESKAKQGNYHLVTLNNSYANLAAISLNLTHPDPVLREIFQNLDFRIGLSHAINRQEIIDKVLGGNGKPYQVAPVPDSPFYHKKLATQYLDYDLKLANKFLDEAGYSKRDAQDLRLGPDGKPITFTLLVSNQPTEYLWADIMKEVQASWQQLGLKVDLKTEERKVFNEQVWANQHDVAVWIAVGGLDVIQNPRYFMPMLNESYFAVPWGYWFQNPDQELAQTPPEEVQKQLALYRQLATTSNPDEQAKLMQQVLDISAEQFYTIGVALPADGFGLVKNNFFNVPAMIPDAWTYPTPAPTNPAQYFIMN